MNAPKKSLKRTANMELEHDRRRNLLVVLDYFHVPAFSVDRSDAMKEETFEERMKRIESYPSLMDRPRMNTKDRIRYLREEGQHELADSLWLSTGD